MTSIQIKKLFYSVVIAGASIFMVACSSSSGSSSNTSNSDNPEICADDTKPSCTTPTPVTPDDPDDKPVPDEPSDKPNDVVKEKQVTTEKQFSYVKGEIRTAQNIKVVAGNVTIDGINVVAPNFYDFNQLPEGKTTKPLENEWFFYELDTGKLNEHRIQSGVIHILNQKYSVVLAELITESTNKTWITKDKYFFNRSFRKGMRPNADAISTLTANKVTATYTGAAFNPTWDGTLTYTVDFASGTGSGTIIGTKRRQGT